MRGPSQRMAVKDPNPLVLISVQRRWAMEKQKSTSASAILSLTGSHENGSMVIGPSRIAWYSVDDLNSDVGSKIANLVINFSFSAGNATGCYVSEMGILSEQRPWYATQGSLPPSRSFGAGWDVDVERKKQFITEDECARRQVILGSTREGRAIIHSLPLVLTNVLLA